MKQIFVLLIAALSLAYNLPTVDTPANLGPLNFYPDNRQERLYKMPFDSGLSINVVRGAFNRPSYSGHKGYEFDFPMAEGHPVLAARAGYVTYINNDIIQISHTERDSLGVHTTQDWYIHIRTTDIPISIPMRVEQGQLITYVRPGLDHVHLEVQMTGHIGIGDAGRTIESVPLPFIEVNRPDGVPFTGDLCQSRNKRFVPSAVEGVRYEGRTPLLSVWPNPCRGLARIQTQGMSTAFQVGIFDLNGGLVKDLGTGNAPSFLWDAGDLPAGNYLLKAMSGRKIISKKLILTR